MPVFHIILIGIGVVLSSGLVITAMVLLFKAIRCCTRGPGGDKEKFKIYFKRMLLPLVAAIIVMLILVTALSGLKP